MSGQKKVAKPFYKKWWVWVIVIFVLAVIGNGMENDTKKEVAEPEKVEAVAEVKEIEKPKPEGENVEAEKDYTTLISTNRNFADSCFNYEYGAKDYLTFDFEKDTDSQNYEWDNKAVTVTTKDGTELEWELTNKDDVSFKFVDSEEYIVKIKYNRIKGEEKYQTFAVKKSDIVVGQEFNPSQCTEESPSTDIPDVDVDGVCLPGETWVKGHYRKGTWVDGHCRS